MNRIEHRMTQEELIASVGDIKRHAIPLYKCKENVFPGEPRKERWRSCMLIIIDTYRHLGPQSFNNGSEPILL